MKDTLLFGQFTSWQSLRPSRTFVRNAAMMIGAYVLLTFATFAIARAAAIPWYPSCTAGENVIEYPVYNARGVQIDSEFHCGVPRRSCTLKGQISKGPLYECPGLMRPR